MITNWSDLTLGKYLEILKVANAEGEDIDKQVCYIAILSDKTEDEILSLPITEYAKYAEQMKFLLQPADKLKRKVTDCYIIDGKKYRLTTDYRLLTTAQYIDFQSYTKNATDHIVELISVFLVPDGKKYTEGYDVREVQRAISDSLTVPEANAMVAFFLSRLRISIKAILISLVWMSWWNRRRRVMLKKLKKQVEMVFSRSGVGLSQ